MKIRIAIIAACVGTLALTQVVPAQAQKSYFRAGLPRLLPHGNAKQMTAPRTTGSGKVIVDKNAKRGTSINTTRSNIKGQ